MTFYCTTHELLHCAWTIQGTVDQPPSTEWDYTRTPCISLIDTWEIVEHIPGVATVAAAHSPFCEYYVIVPRLSGVDIEEFFGSSASDRCCERCRQLGITLTESAQYTNLYSSTTKL